MDDAVKQKVGTFFGSYPIRSFEKRQLIIRADEMPTGAYYIVEGRVSQYDITPNGNEVVVNVFKAGAFFPMSTAINKTPNVYFFEASTAVRVHEAPLADTVQFLKDNPDVAFDLLARVYRGVDTVLRRMAHLMASDSRSRLLFELLNAANRFGEVQPDASVHIPLKEGDLAKHSGLARETVSRCLQGLKADGLVRIVPNGLIISGIDQLESALGSAL